MLAHPTLLRPGPRRPTLQAVLYCPSEPKDCALKLHSLLQKFSWTESEVGQ